MAEELLAEIAEIDEIEEKRAHHNGEAERHRSLRDEYNDKTREWVDRRDALNGKVRELVDQANKHREDRDTLNAEVKKAKASRDEFNHKAAELAARVQTLKRERMPQSGLSLRMLKTELMALEKRHMTTVLSPDKERALVEEISELSTQIRTLEREVEQYGEVRQAEAELRSTKEQGEEAHRQVAELAERAQTEHDAMLKLYEQADALRREADAAQEKFLETKTFADEEHRKHIEHIRQVHDYDKLLYAIHQRDRKARKAVDEDAARREAEEIFARFQSGEKLSTEDLLVLQKSGYI